MARDVGEMAQSTLQVWAAQENITANRATVDREGWDYLLQFPQVSPASGMPLDLRPTRIEALVQVKGVESRRQRKSIPLSNWERLTTTPLPAFFLVIDFGASDEPQEAFLVHVDDTWAAKALKRLRTLNDEEKGKLNDLTLDLTWDKTDALPSLNGKGLKAAIEKHIGADFDVYVERKQKGRKTIGLDAELRISITSEPFANADELTEQWVDVAIGVRDSIPVSKTVIEKNVRFGIPAERQEMEGGVISFGDRSNSGKELRLEFGNTAQSRVSVFQARVFTPDPFFPGNPVPKHLYKVRITTEMGEFILRPYAEDRTLQVKLGIEYLLAPRGLSELANLWRVTSIFANTASDGCYLELSDGQNLPFRVELLESLFQNAEILETAGAIEQAWRLAKQLDVPPETVVAPQSIFAQKANFDTLDYLCDLNKSIFRLGGHVSGGPPGADKEQAVVFGRVLHFGNLMFGVLLGFAGHIVVTDAPDDDKPFEIRDPKRVLLEHHRLPRRDKEDYIQLIRHAYNRLEARGYEVIRFVD